jgi:TonB family protein
MNGLPLFLSLSLEFLMPSSFSPRLRWLWVSCVCASVVWAHEADGGVDDDADGGAISHVVVPPKVLSAVEAAYPPAALRERRETHVHLELQVGATGQVTDVRVLESGGEEFDGPAMEAVKQYTFTPATEDGVPVRSFVTYTYAFHLPERANQDDGGVAPAAMTTVVMAQRPLSASSSFSVRDRDFALRPIGSVQDILRITPGLVMVQHSGGGKANQYFMRGFDADHGTDIALSIDGVPINMVSHAHGQGFADTNFIIPEVVEKVEITKGTSFANQGDFATAGSVNMVSRESFEHSSFGLGFSDSPGHGKASLRALAIASPKFDQVKATFAAEIGQANGPFDHPDTWNKYKLFNRLTFELSPTSSLSVVHMGYGGDWNGSGQIAQRAVDQGLITRFGSLDPTEGGDSTRHQVQLQYKLKPDAHSELKAMAYVGTYRFNLFSNFTGSLNDAVNGDEIEQVDRRTFFGGKLSYRVVHELFGVRFDTTVGADVRNDDIHNQLWHTAQRQQLGTAQRDNAISETLAGLFLSEDITPFRWLHLNVGGRADVISYAVDNLLTVADATAPTAGVGSAYQLSPKANLVLSPFQREGLEWDVYLNWGHGFHTNDVRGVFSTPKVAPIVRAVGEEVGTRARLWNRWDLAATLWQLDLANETVWNGDDGTTAVGDPTKRYGVEFETRFELTSWLAADLDLTFTHSQFSTDGSNGGGLALAPKQTWAGGLSARHELGPGVVRGGLRFYGIGDRPATDDGALIAPGFTQFDLHLGYRHRRFDLALDIENLFNGVFRSAQFATVSRLANEPAIGSAVPAGFSCGKNARLAASSTGTFAGCEDVDYTPAYPFTVRLTATVYLD